MPPPRQLARAAAALAAALLLPLPARGAWSDGDAGIANNGVNASSTPLPSNATADCFAACVASPSCAAWQVTPSTPACTGGAPAVCTLKSTFGARWAGREGALDPVSLNACAISGIPVRNGTPVLQPLAFTPPPLASVTPSGWLRDELALHASGLTGYLNLFWPDVMNSTWVGGDGDGYLHERGPYWLNGAVPLSVLLGEGAPAPPAPYANLTTQLDTYLSYIADHAAPSGWLGPDDTASGDQFWARMPLLTAMTQWVEGHPRDAPKYIPAICRYVVEARRRMLAGPYQLNDWSAARVQDYIITLWGLIDHFAELQAAGLVPPGVTEATLYHAAYVAHAQGIGNGAIWEDYFDGPLFPEGPVLTNFGMLDHGVNVAQAIKSAGVWWRALPNASLTQSSYTRMARLDAFHGSPTGVVQADEHLAGPEPQHGTELCGVVEAMYSYEWLGAIYGDPAFFERAELIAYNALPGTMTKDVWAVRGCGRVRACARARGRVRAWARVGASRVARTPIRIATVSHPKYARVDSSGLRFPSA